MIVYLLKTVCLDKQLVVHGLPCFVVHLLLLVLINSTFHFVLRSQGGIAQSV
jgi:hypothetical protein